MNFSKDKIDPNNGASMLDSQLSLTEAASKGAIALLLAPLLAAFFAGLLTLSFALDNGEITKNIARDFDYMRDATADNGRMIDTLTECTGVAAGLNRLEDDTLFKAAMRANTPRGCGGLGAFLENPKPRPAYFYYRYWHGYAVLLRPLLSITPYHEIRGHFLTVSLLLFGLLAWRLANDFNGRVALAFVLPFFVLNGFGFWILATKAVTWFIAAGGALFMSRRRGPPPLLAFFVIGALTAYFDFLTAPMLCFTLPMLTWLLYAEPQTAKTNHLAAFGVCFGFFFFGYFGLWAIKFLIAQIALGEPVWRDAITAATQRLRGSEGRIQTFWLGKALYKNWDILGDLWGPIAIALFVVAPLSTRKRRSAIKKLAHHRPALLATAIAPLIWLETLSNHSQLHAHFTHINYAPLFIVSSLIVFGAGSAINKEMRPLGHGSAS
ncbi:MAG: hypothetical protein AAF850_05715 [Pseudomonadota bacterium]